MTDKTNLKSLNNLNQYETLAYITHEENTKKSYKEINPPINSIS